MRNLDIATLRSLQAVAEYGAVTRAAEALNMTQSALSMQMKRLEDVFEQAMLVKQGRGVVLSDFATELLMEARKLVALNDAIMARFTGRRPEGRLRVGLTSDWLFNRVAQAVRAFRQDNAGIDLIINDGRSKDLRVEMKRGDHDVILTTEFEAPPGAIHLAKLDLAWVGAVGGKVWTQRPLPIANSPQCAYTPVGLAALDKAGIEWLQTVSDGGKDTWRVLAAADLGITILPRGIAHPGLEAIDHGGALPPLPPTWLNVYVADGPARCLAADFAGYLRRAVCEVAAAA
ncbi:LysR family transcriptional regulator [Paracoccus sp. R12_1]|uniref:LysR family transcriptional regulator n=1 Tax=unclassified Paracoccus (in: a-proteobacteria) TaxID=2688777 RepID=UPI001ADCFF02|nr:MULTISPECIES: LysR family transcriptional regulator [unclassified Paracoccus (in: a-proteobacteria)]MBO9455692.1 LysR family transcriptional regulator [Paracoccus sp. R12_2]MBO9486362.1 LysR family transcriptional regulator [Paracoccus sp. R12_1]